MPPPEERPLFDELMIMRRMRTYAVASDIRRIAYAAAARRSGLSHRMRLRASRLRIYSYAPLSRIAAMADDAAMPQYRHGASHSRP